MTLSLVDSSSQDVLSRLNAHISQTAYAPYVLALTLVALIFAVLLNNAVAVACTGVLGFTLSWLVHNGDKHKRTSEVLYHLADEAAQQFASTQTAFQILSKSQRIWLVKQEQATGDWKRHAGALSLISRSPVSVGVGEPRWISTNVRIWSISLGASKLYFFPDRLLIWDSRKYGAVSYESLNVTFAPTRFIEHGSVPGDSEVVDYTWRYVNKNGGPDRRFANNTRLPVTLYGSLTFTSLTKPIALLHVSSRQLASQFAEGFRVRVQQTTSGHDSSATGSNSESRTQGQRSDGRRKAESGGAGQRRQGRETQVQNGKPASAWEILGVRVGASMDEVSAAYHRTAQMYHPDKVATLGPEFRELAERRMKEINAAYDELKHR